jgi:excisionase family DNA binding protein
MEVELLTVDQLAARLNLKASTVRNWVKAGRIPSVRLGYKTIRFSWLSVMTALQSPKLKGSR